MKINLTITELTPSDVTELMAKITGSVPLISDVKIASPVLTEPSIEDSTEGDGSGLDSTGLPWDGRIHSSNKGKKADGTWNKRRGVQEPEIKSVEAELRASMSVQAPVVQTPVTQAPAQPVPPTEFQPVIPPMDNAAIIAAYTSVQPALPPVVAPVVQAPVVAPVVQAPSLSGRDMQGVLVRIQNACGQGKLNMDGINAIIGQVNTAFQLQLKAITDISVRADLIEYVHQILDHNQF